VEPVHNPTTVPRVAQTDRIRRAQPRGDSGGRSAFARYLRRESENPEDAPHAPAEEPDEAADALPAETPAEGNRQTPTKRVDIRV
jgi:hypothetical protein